MTTLTKEVYDAFRAAGVPEEQATAAAEAIETGREKDRIQRLETDVTLIKWMIGFNIALTTAILFKLLL